MDKIVLYGTGRIFRQVLPILSKHFDIVAVIARNSDLWGKKISGVPVIGLDEFTSGERYKSCRLVISVSDKNMWAVMNKMREKNVTEYTTYYELLYGIKAKERILSYCYPPESEDIVLYHVFHDFEDIFYIDVGSYDPILGSITKFMYDVKDAHGINIEPLEEHREITNRERKRDINLCLGLGERETVADFFVQGAMSTLEENIRSDVFGDEVRKIKIETLENICDKYVPDGQRISFLKIDVEGAEKRVLQGANFKKYRPMVVIMESVVPVTNEPSYESWENILTGNEYHFAFSYGVNRYYVADECSTLDERFLPVDELKLRYNVINLFETLAEQL